LSGTLYAGDFESEDSRVLCAASLTITSVVLARHLDSRATSAAGLRYFVLPAMRRAFLVHLIDAPPSFEKVVVVNASPSGWAAWSPGILAFLDYKDDLASRLTPANMPLTATTSNGATLMLTVVRSLQTLVGPNFDMPVPKHGGDEK